MLVKLCVETEPTPAQLVDLDDNAYKAGDMLFSEDLINAREMYLNIKNGEYSGLAEVTRLMKQANSIWSFRNRIKKIGWDEYTNIDYKITNLLRQNQKINAIKEYRAYMKDVMKVECGLKESKEYVDKIAAKLGLGT